jgi:hypothetical protein
MRLSTLILTISLATAAFAFLPSADATTQICTAVTADDCGGWVCKDDDGDRAWSDGECVSKRDLDRCQFQSDCCSSMGFWCPETD